MSYGKLSWQLFVHVAVLNVTLVPLCKNNAFLKGYYQRMHGNTSSTSCSFSAQAQALKGWVKGNSIENGRVLTVLKTEVYSFIQDISYYKCVKLGEWIL